MHVRAGRSRNLAHLGPLRGATIFVLVEGEEESAGGDEAKNAVRGLGGRVSCRPEDSTLVLWWEPSSFASEGTQQQLQRCRALRKPVVKPTWLDSVAALPRSSHWREVQVGPHVPAVVACAEAIPCARFVTAARVVSEPMRAQSLPSESTPQDSVVEVDDQGSTESDAPSPIRGTIVASPPSECAAMPVANPVEPSGVADTAERPQDRRRAAYRRVRLFLYVRRPGFLRNQEFMLLQVGTRREPACHWPSIRSAHRALLLTDATREARHDVVAREVCYTSASRTSARSKGRHHRRQGEAARAAGRG